MARNKKIFVRSDAMPPPGGWPAHVTVVYPPKKRTTLNVMVPQNHSLSANHRAHCFDCMEHDEGDEEERSSDEDTSSDSPTEREGSDTEQPSDSSPPPSLTPSDADSSASGDLSEKASENSWSVGTHCSFLTESYLGVHRLTVREIKLICGAESVPSIMPPLFCASLAMFTDDTASFAERFPGVKLLSRSELAEVCGVNVSSFETFGPLPPLFRELGRRSWEDSHNLRLYNGSEAALLCGFPSQDAYSASFRGEIEVSEDSRRQAEKRREAKAAMKRVAIASSTPRRSTRLQRGSTSLVVDQVVPKSARMNSGLREAEKSALPPALSIGQHQGPSTPLKSSQSNSEDHLLSFASLSLDTSFPPGSTVANGLREAEKSALPPAVSKVDQHQGPSTPDKSNQSNPGYIVSPRVNSWAYAASASNNRVDKFLRWPYPLTLAIVEIVRDAIETFWDFDNHLFFRISDWQLQRDVYLLGSGLRPPPVVIVDNIIFTSSRMAFTSTASPLAPSLLASMQALTASLQEALLLLQGLGEIGIPDRICRALNFNARCKALLRDDHGFATWFAAHLVGDSYIEFTFHLMHACKPCERCGRLQKPCNKAPLQAGCETCVTAKVRCDMQENYLFEKMAGEFNGQRHAFDTMRSAGKPRRRQGDRGTRGALSAPPVTSSPASPPPPVMPLDVDNYSIVHTAVLPNAKAAMSMNVDSIVSDDAESMVVDMPSVVDSVMASRSMDVASGSMDVASGSIDKGVQTDGQKPSDVNDTVVLPGVPLEALDLDDLCRMVRSLSSRVSYLQSLRDSNRSLTSLSAHEIPAELVAQCVEAIFSGHFDMLVTFCSTKHRLLTADMSPDVKEHMEHLFQQCHKCLSQMLGRLDEGRRLAPDVFLTASPPT
ncbi:hypothetical protein B0H16DRAFT_1478140 [Mycena metata]|uniref:Uncharacterized protein n=1 Tax=Mycena metata TaxID=1033252 RepID=A0AAD7MF41_9AGAR|nr:hypothetical protein B0H16DRAFT_1478140 [Mycena metata]